MTPKPANQTTPGTHVFRPFPELGRMTVGCPRCGLLVQGALNARMPPCEPVAQ